MFSVVMAVLVVAGIFLLVNKGTYLLRGYNSLSDEEKAGASSTYNTKRISIVLGIMCLVLAVLVAGVIVALELHIEWLIITCFVLISVTCIGVILLVNLSKAFKMHNVRKDND